MSDIQVVPHDDVGEAMQLASIAIWAEAFRSENGAAFQRAATADKALSAFRQAVCAPPIFTPPAARERVETLQLIAVADRMPNWDEASRAGLVLWFELSLDGLIARTAPYTDAPKLGFGNRRATHWLPQSAFSV